MSGGGGSSLRLLYETLHASRVSRSRHDLSAGTGLIAGASHGQVCRWSSKGVVCGKGKEVGFGVVEVVGFGVVELDGVVSWSFDVKGTGVVVSGTGVVVGCAVVEVVVGCAVVELVVWAGVVMASPVVVVMWAVVVVFIGATYVRSTGKPWQVHSLLKVLHFLMLKHGSGQVCQHVRSLGIPLT